MRDFKFWLTLRKRDVLSSATNLEPAAKNPLDRLLHERMQIALDVCHNTYDNDRQPRLWCSGRRCDNVYC